MIKLHTGNYKKYFFGIKLTFISIHSSLDYNPNAMFVRTDHGGHLGYFEGGWFFHNEMRWTDRLIFQYITALKNV